MSHLSDSNSWLRRIWVKKDLFQSPWNQVLLPFVLDFRFDKAITHGYTIDSKYEVEFSIQDNIVFLGESMKLEVIRILNNKFVLRHQHKERIFEYIELELPEERVNFSHENMIGKWKLKDSQIDFLTNESKILNTNKIQDSHYGALDISPLIEYDSNGQIKSHGTYQLFSYESTFFLCLLIDRFYMVNTFIVNKVSSEIITLGRISEEKDTLILSKIKKNDATNKNNRHIFE